MALKYSSSFASIAAAFEESSCWARRGADRVKSTVSAVNILLKSRCILLVFRQFDSFREEEAGISVMLQQVAYR